MIEKTNISNENDRSDRLAKVANWIKQITDIVVIKEAVHAFANTYLYTRYGLNTTSISTIWLKTRNFSLININTEPTKATMSQDTIIDLSQDNIYGFNIPDIEDEQELVAEIPQTSDAYDRSRQVLVS